jgi:hypothetical protein
MGQKFPLIHAAKEELKGYKVANLDAQSSNINTAYGQAIGEPLIQAFPNWFIRKQLSYILNFI